jgi:sulfoxide reductase heme-binding subunit YedZ
MPAAQPYLWLKPAVLTGALVPIPTLVLRGLRGDLGANPIAEVLNRLGLVALVFLVAALACTPLKTLTGWTWPIRIRRMLGVLAFFYAVLHVSTYAGLDQDLDWNAILADVLKRKFIYVGFATFVLLAPLAATSTNRTVRWLGFTRWKQLHRLAYVASVLAVVHFFFRVKKDVREPLTYGAIVAALLLARVLTAWQARGGAAQRARQRAGVDVGQIGLRRISARATRIHLEGLRSHRWPCIIAMAVFDGYSTDGGNHAEVPHGRCGRVQELVSEALGRSAETRHPDHRDQARQADRPGRSRTRGGEPTHARRHGDVRGR